MSKLKALILDDEVDSVKLLRLEIEKHCPAIDKIHTCSSPTIALKDIPLFEPDIVFTDVEMPEINGFELLEKLMPLRFKVIFITAFNKYALRAFRFNALDYLLKPVVEEELKAAVTRAEQQLFPTQSQLTEADRNLKGGAVARIAISSTDGVSIIKLDNILYVEASNNYSKMFLADGRTILLSKTLKDTQDTLEESHFLRIHRQYIVNLNYVKHFNKNECLLTMENNIQLPIVKNRFDRFLDKYYRL